MLLFANNLDKLLMRLFNASIGALLFFLSSRIAL
uniref:Uncharacterized protein n=1 Tax=virus sp. ctBM815 TaxID=2825806 RepID=A0A8S5RJP3_9VIRU|nr:MAG TPA: hypothetical protein [virus sp. ctBM815]